MTSRSVLITGCSRGGAGEALAQIFLRHGFRVFATARSLAKIQHLGAEGIEILELDVVNHDSASKVASKVSSLTGGKLDILISNAGAGYMSPILDVDHTKASKLFDVNVPAPINLIQEFSALLIAARGTIVNIGSYVDALPVPWQGIYNASKAAFRSITDNLRLELRPFDVKVVYIAAGGIRSNFLDNLETIHISKSSLYYPAREKLEPIMNYEAQKDAPTSMLPEEFAQKVYKGATSGASEYRVYAGTQTPLSGMPAAQRDDVLAEFTGIKSFTEMVKQTTAQ